MPKLSQRELGFTAVISRQDGSTVPFVEHTNPRLIGCCYCSGIHRRDYYQRVVDSQFVTCLVTALLFCYIPGNRKLKCTVWTTNGH
jgi:hypothetical protein